MRAIENMAILMLLRSYPDIDIYLRNTVVPVMDRCGSTCRVSDVDYLGQRVYCKGFKLVSDFLLNFSRIDACNRKHGYFDVTQILPRYRYIFEEYSCTCYG